MTAGEKITALRAERGMSVAGLARAAGLTRPTVYAAEAGRTVDLLTLVSIAGALGVPLSEISQDAAKLLEGVA